MTLELMTAFEKEGKLAEWLALCLSKAEQQK
jgi:hypothetical protein